MTDTPATNLPSTMVIREVRGRGSSPERGLAALHSVTLEDADGNQTLVGRISDPNAVDATLTIVLTAERRDFDRCPLCLTPNPTSEEHVPPDSLGGSIMTVTCLRCNNEFGSRLEVDLLNWWEDAANVRFANDRVQGARRSPRILFRQIESGEPMLFIDRGTVDPAIIEMLQSGEIQARFEPPDMNRVRVAILKSAYLAACIFGQEIPDTPRARAIREELMIARDAPRRRALVLGPMARGLTFGRINTEPAIPGEVALASFTPPGRDRGEAHISLGRRLLVQWPLEEPHFVPVAAPVLGA